MLDNRIITFPLKLPGRRRSFDRGYIDLVRIRHYPGNPTTSEGDLLAPVRVEHPGISRTSQTPALSSSSSSNISYDQYPKPRGLLIVFCYTLRRIVYILDNLGYLARDTCLGLIFTSPLPVLFVVSVITWLVLSIVGKVYFVCMRALTSVMESKTQDSHDGSQTSKGRPLRYAYKDWRKKKYIFENFGALCFIICFFYGSCLYRFWSGLIDEILGPAFDT